MIFAAYIRYEVYSARFLSNVRDYDKNGQSGNAPYHYDSWIDQYAVSSLGVTPVSRICSDAV